MIRFLNLKDQIIEDEPSFAFYDTISDTIMSFGINRDQVFASKEYFIECYRERYMKNHSTRPLVRFLSLIPNNYFKSQIQ